ncbi:hypothetical protein [Bradyrhizobium sp. Ce-3]|uniref:hypothetical protein n=1 Tax=Bradyrhizobium sp. Ce-3 TaxID=2913970 RepID=UPI001FC7E70E|nr:hypothetical protein [Bradyrhizobium sp. Ce-3]
MAAGEAIPILYFLSVLAARVERTVWPEPMAPVRLPAALAVVEVAEAAALETLPAEQAGSALAAFRARRAAMAARAVPEVPTRNPFRRPTILHRSPEAQAGLETAGLPASVKVRTPVAAAAVARAGTRSS